MHKGMRRKLKVYAVDANGDLPGIPATAVIKGGKMEIAAMPSQGVVLEEREEIQIPEGWGEPETETHDTSGSLIKSRDWSVEDAEILLKIAMAEAEGESVEGKALVMLVVLNRVWSEGFPDSISEVVFQDGQFTPTEEGGGIGTRNRMPDAMKHMRWYFMDGMRARGHCISAQVVRADGWRKTQSIYSQ